MSLALQRISRYPVLFLRSTHVQAPLQEHFPTFQFRRGKALQSNLSGGATVRRLAKSRTRFVRASSSASEPTDTSKEHAVEQSLKSPIDTEELCRVLRYERRSDYKEPSFPQILPKAVIDTPSAIYSPWPRPEPKDETARKRKKKIDRVALRTARRIQRRDRASGDDTIDVKAYLRAGRPLFAVSKTRTTKELEDLVQEMIERRSYDYAWEIYLELIRRATQFWEESANSKAEDTAASSEVKLHDMSKDNVRAENGNWDSKADNYDTVTSSNEKRHFLNYATHSAIVRAISPRWAQRFSIEENPFPMQAVRQALERIEQARGYMIKDGYEFGKLEYLQLMRAASAANRRDLLESSVYEMIDNDVDVDAAVFDAYLEFVVGNVSNFHHKDKVACLKERTQKEYIVSNNENRNDKWNISSSYPESTVDCKGLGEFVLDLLEKFSHKQAFICQSSTFELLLLAYARDVDARGVLTILNLCWGIAPENSFKRLESSSVLYPRPETVIAAVTALGFTGQVELAWKVAKQFETVYKLQMTDQTFEKLLLWCRLRSWNHKPLHDVGANTVDPALTMIVFETMRTEHSFAEIRRSMWINVIKNEISRGNFAGSHRLMLDWYTYILDKVDSSMSNVGINTRNAVEFRESLVTDKLLKFVEEMLDKMKVARFRSLYKENNLPLFDSQHQIYEFWRAIFSLRKEFKLSVSDLEVCVNGPGNTAESRRLRQKLLADVSDITSDANGDRRIHRSILKLRKPESDEWIQIPMPSGTKTRKEMVAHTKRQDKLHKMWISVQRPLEPYTQLCLEDEAIERQSRQQICNE